MIQQIENAIANFTLAWWNLAGKPVPQVRTYDIAAKKRNEKQVNGLVADLEKKFENHERIDEADRIYVKKLILPFAAKFSPMESNLFTGELFDRFIDTARVFVSRARAFDPSVSVNDIAQAVRNLWVINVIQVLFGREVILTECAFAYSMLYPCTDNFLDDDSLCSQERKHTILRFGERLKGEMIPPATGYEEQLWKLVEMMETERERTGYARFYESLAAIQDAQVTSMGQQQILTLPYCTDILGLSMRKGGTSVLVDGFIAKNELDENEFELMFGFGVLLQLIDDLQDVHDDKLKRHCTLFSQLAGHWKLDELAEKLIVFSGQVSAGLEVLPSPYTHDICKLVLENCQLLIQEAIVKNKRYFSAGMVKNAESQLFVRSRFLRNLKKKYRGKKARKGWILPATVNIIPK